MAQKTKKELNEDFINACADGELEKAKYLLTSPELKSHADIHVDDDYAFHAACTNGHIEIVKYLLTSPDLKEHVKIREEINSGFIWACRDGHLEVVKYLLTSKDLKEHADIHSRDDYGLRWACQYGETGVVQYLINETQFYSIDNVETIEFDENSKISKNDILDMIKVRGLKNQLLDEVSLVKPHLSKNKVII